MAKKYRPRKTTKVEEIVETIPYTIIRDTQEKSGVWNFIKTDYCTGTEDGHLITGDYTIKGLEEIFSIERKASSGELSGNLTTKRFENELKRGDKLKHFFLILEFNLSDIYSFPYNSTIPRHVWPRLRVTSKYLLKRIVEIETKYKVKIIFAGDGTNAKEIARQIFKEMWSKYGEEINRTRPA